MPKKSQENICDEKLFNNLFLKHAKEIHDFLYYKYGADNYPKDLVQEAFIKLWNNCDKIVPEKARSFLFTVANNQVLNDLSKKKTVLKYRLEKPKGYTIESPEYVMEEKEFMNSLQTAIEGLSEEQRVAFLLNRVEGKKHQEIADMLGISRKGVEKRIYTALRILKKKVGKI